MFDELTYERFEILAKSHKRIAVHREIPGDKLTPTNAFLALEGIYKYITLLESSPQEKNLSRYSHLCFDPLITLKSYGEQVLVNHQGHCNERTGNPFDILREYQQTFFTKVDNPLCGFIGGMVGYITYDAIRLMENIPDRHTNSHELPDLLFRFYTKNITFDHQTGKVILTTAVDIQESVEKSYESAVNSLNEISKLLFAPQEHQEESLSTPISLDLSKVTVDLETEDFCERVEKAKHYIKEGDIFQVVLSREFQLKTKAKPFDIYRALQFSNPSPYMFYLEGDDYVITGASPEKLISIKNRIIESCPLAGTRPRNLEQEELLSKELLDDEKEVAEHMMLVDLARNDLGRISKPNTVKVTRLKEIEKYSRVLHISSSVQGELREDQDVFHAIKAAFPAGTLSGAPKIRAMEIIDELETSKRGIYGGIICGIDSHGNLDSCIAIRTAFIKNGVATVRAGAGIVNDSIPEKEAQETYHKAQAVLEGLLLGEMP